MVGPRIWGAHAPRVLAMAPSPSRTFPFQNIAARRRNEHARRVRSPERKDGGADVILAATRTIQRMLTLNRYTAPPFHRSLIFIRAISGCRISFDMSR